MGGGVAEFDLTLSLAEQHDDKGAGAGVRGALEYSLDLFGTRRPPRRHGRRVAVCDPAQPVSCSAIEVLDPGERHTLGAVTHCPAGGDEDAAGVVRGSGGGRPFPDAVAVVCDDGELTYQERNARGAKPAGADGVRPKPSSRWRCPAPLS